MTSYETIFNAFLRKIDDVELANQIESDSQYVIEDMIGWLHSAVAKLGNIDCDSLVLDDDAETMTAYDTSNNEVDLSEFAIEAYSIGMQIEWLTPIVNRTTSLKQVFGGKEEKYYSQQQHLTAMIAMLNDAKQNLQRMIIDHGFKNNSYIN